MSQFVDEAQLNTMLLMLGSFTEAIPLNLDVALVREDGAWKFHRIRARLTFQSPYDKGWVKEPVASSSGAFLDIAPTRPSTYHMPYNPYRISVFQPEPPKKPF